MAELDLGVCRIQAASNPYAGKSQPIVETRTRYSRKFRVNRAKGDVCCPHLTAKRDQSDRLLENYTATITNFTLEERDAAGNVTREASPWRDDGNARMAFVPSARGFSMSLWQEGDEDSPYGAYWLHFEPAGQ